MEDSNHIADRIRSTRQELGSKLRQLQDRFPDAASWRAQYERRPWMFVGAAFAGGLLLAAAVSGYRHRAAHHREGYAAAASASVGAGSRRDSPAAAEIWNHFKDALIAVAGTQIRNFLHDVVPRIGDTERHARIKSGNGHGLRDTTTD